ncbi:laccase [Dichomitus squalens LYAD-421 SS1]|uniref:laccase n=1 Tax=Dichomitus squalens (strain LYAD-421) TaxID=732165 RepID=R7SWM9_DICSQ|nr:laccase [Dichomitus squalens LYAD-421 SS1]EJF60579.1 laccase [Dichomitus squalens LYAD-421 SS1]
MASLAYLVHRCSAQAGPITTLNIVDAAVTPDGYTRQAVLPNGTFPGPLIIGNKNDNFQINVIDLLTNETMLTGTTVHWHGLFQHSTAYADGTAFVTQCPLTPNNSFLYNFTATGQAGTFWYHSHYMTQYCDGLRGPLVIYDPEDPYLSSYDVDDESTVITLADWLHIAARLGPRFPTPNATLINGLGRYTGGPAEWPLSVITVEQGKRYRFRLLNMACEPNYNFTIDSHNFTIIEADGEYTEPLEVDFIQIFAAQRYSIILNATQAVDNYWIRANPSVALPDGQGFAGGINSAILRYVGAPDSDPTTNQTPSVIPLNESNLHALVDPIAPGQPFPGGADVNINLDFTFNATTQLFYANNVSYASPSVPVLLQILSGTPGALDLMPAGSVYYLPPNKSIEISFPALPAATPGEPHPFHLHGHAFSVVRSAGQVTPNYVNPVRRDTVSIGEVGDNVTIRFETNNPGPWFLHCHIDWHLEAGMAVVMAEDVPDIPKDVVPSKSWDQLCPTWSAYGQL